MPKISEERRVLAALAILVVVGLASLSLAFARQAQIRDDAPVEGPPSPTCNALTNFNFADLLAMRAAATPGFTPADPKTTERIDKLAAARTQLAADAPDYVEPATARATFVEHTLRAQAISDDERNAASEASSKLVEAQRKRCPVSKPGTTTTKPGTTVAKPPASPTTVAGP